MTTTTVRTHKAYADTPLGQVHYYSIGSGDPVLMLHQSPSSSSQFEAAWPFLTEAGFRVLAMDTPGFGRSDTPPMEPTIEDYASVIPYVLDDAGVQTVDVVGHHTGVETAFEAAGLFPNRFRKLVAHGVPLFTAEERKEWLDRVVTREKIPMELKADGSHLAQRFARSIEICPDLKIAQRNLLAALGAGDLYWYGHSAAFIYDLKPRLLELQLPMLFMSNTGDMIHDETLRAHALRPDAELAVLDGGTIHIVDEQPKEWVAAIVKFLRK